jgi:hypothetical protein
MEKWLFCEISPGQFSNECAVAGTLSNGSGFSMFVPKEYLRFKGYPSKNTTIEGFMKINVLESGDDSVLISLPQPTLENGKYITVKKNCIKDSNDPIE